MENNSSVARQVDAAKKQLEDWPDWMRKAGRLEGGEVSDADRKLQDWIDEAKVRETTSSESEENNKK